MYITVEPSVLNSGQISIPGDKSISHRALILGAIAEGQTEALGLKAFQPEAHSPTYPAFRPLRRLDWILISDELDFGGYGTLPVSVSDHLVVTADLVLDG